MDLKNIIVLGDCIEKMKLIPDCTMAGCVTDPPYNYEFIGRNWDYYEINRRTSRVESDSSTLVKNIPYGSGLAGGVRNKRWYSRNRENVLKYQDWCEKWGKELFRILKPGAYALVFNSTRTVAQVQVAMENVGFYARDILVWKRPSGIPKGLNYAKKLAKMGVDSATDWDAWHSCLRNEWEAISVVQKPLVNNYLQTMQTYGVGLMKAKNNNGFLSNIIDGVKRDKTDEYNIHCTVKPLELIKKLAELVVPISDENILIDPFLGSGTTAVACKELGINYYGIEINQEYVDIAHMRINECINKQDFFSA